MKTVAQLMATSVVTAKPIETVTAVVQRLRAHEIGGLPVVQGGRVVGIVTLKDLVGQPPYRLVREVMTTDVVTVPPAEWITTAYAVMDARKIGRLPVVDGESLIGIITRADLLQELGKLTDPLTDLPWSGTLRQKAAELLKSGQEITVLFIDLDDFGIVNKLYGHVVGDHIINAVADLLQTRTDLQTDLLCRYGGDEFAIVTTRTMEASEALATDLREAIVQVSVPGAPPGAISASIGIAGGKRASERQDVHHEATVDDLITMASRASTLAKRTNHHVLHGHAPQTALADGSARRLAIRRIDLGMEEGRGTATVELERDGRRVTGQTQGPILGLGGMRLLVEATVSAVRQLLPPDWDIAVEEITRTPLVHGEALNILLICGTPAQEEHLLGSAIYTSDPHEAAVKATMKAMNWMLAHVRLTPVSPA